jgi:hypothetical protein
MPVEDLRADVQELFMLAAARIGQATPEQMGGSQRLLERLLSEAADNDVVKVELERFGLRTVAAAREFLEAIGEGDLQGDVSALGFITCVGLAFVTPDEPEPEPGSA